MILIGSKALKIVAPQLLTRESKDYDFIATHDEFKAFVRANNFRSVIPHNSGSKMICRGEGLLPIEVEIAWEGTSAELLTKMLHTTTVDIPELNLTGVRVPNLDVLFAIKASHRYRKNSVHFLKTMKDYNAMKPLCSSIAPDLKEFHKLREKETYTYAHPKLNTSKKDFFNPEQVKYVYEHDTIHLAMAHLERPAYSYFQDAEVRCVKDLFNELPHRHKLYSVLEESYVLAIERSQVPFPGKCTPRQSFLMALEKVCTSISSGWWREFAYNHYNEVLELFDENYMETFKKGIDNGIVLLYNDKTNAEMQMT